MTEVKRYAIVGLGHRSLMYTDALNNEFKDYGKLVAFCDTNQSRMDYYNRYFQDLYQAPPLPTYLATDFDRMLAEQRPDRLIVTSIDRTHHEYIVRAMEAGCDVITEKPMTVDAEKARAILETQKKTGRQLIVTFNYRYAPLNSKIKELLQSGAIGDIISVHFEWLLDTSHGADYFRRWHRNKENSGGLMVHKATHHFDLVNWWLSSRPETVFGFGKLAFYGRQNGLARGEVTSYPRYRGYEEAKTDPYGLDLSQDERLTSLYLEAEHEDNYFRDKNVFAEDIDIEDDMALVIRYDSGATMTYHLTAYSPWEGYRIAFNGSKGRLEILLEENSYRLPRTSYNIEATAKDVTLPPRIVLRPLWEKPVEIDLPTSTEGGHGGGDIRLLRDVFVGADNDPLGRAAGHLDGATSIMTGIAANRAFKTGEPVRVSDLLDIPAKV
ncbi:MAG: Gfo/Idh/MocA family oxidoreductase [Chloroflexi bacterium]|nr:Gfo/Idh/MocA family oxidoreductase [Chloroflexota bacterium]OJW06109.1 MAG: dehydrogenase [Chloroflexi bacterium 54-19]